LACWTAFATTLINHATQRLEQIGITVNLINDDEVIAVISEIDLGS